MAEIIKESVTRENDGRTEAVTTEVKREASSSQTIEYIVYFIFGMLNVLLLFRLFFKVTGANASSSFVSFIYDITEVFIMPFQGIFNRGTTQELGTTSVFEPSILVALAVYAVLAWGIVKLINILSGKKQY